MKEHPLLKKLLPHANSLLFCTLYNCSELQGYNYLMKRGANGQSNTET
jgi:hypothetical protein